MKLRTLVVVLIAVPAAAQASSRVSLLAGQTLRVAPGFGLLAQADAPPPPPPADVPPPPPGNPSLVPEEEPPSLGAVIGFMAGGGAAMGTGAILTLVGLVVIAAGNSTTDTTGVATSTFNAVGIVYIVIGLAIAGTGVFLFIHGNSLRNRRNAYNEAHGITDGDDVPPRPKLALPPTALAWSF